MRISEFEKMYGFNSVRIDLIRKLKVEIEAMQVYIDPLRVLVFGSFVSDVGYPNDIDVLAHGLVLPSKRSDYLKNGVDFSYISEVQVQRDFKLQQESKFKLGSAKEIVKMFSSKQKIDIPGGFVNKYVEVSFA